MFLHVASYKPLVLFKLHSSVLYFKLSSQYLLESLQNVRKHRMIQQDKLRSFETSFLANYIGDFNHNMRRYEESLKKIEREFTVIQRDQLWRIKKND